MASGFNFHASGRWSGKWRAYRTHTVRLPREPTRRVRYWTKAQAQRLLQELPSHSVELAAFSLAPGYALNGEVIAQVNTVAREKALKRAGIDDFRWHDLRHTWASWHVQNGTPLNVLQELGGWESPQMVRRYAHFSASHLAAYADRLPALVVAG